MAAKGAKKAKAKKKVARRPRRSKEAAARAAAELGELVRSTALEVGPARLLQLDFLPAKGVLRYQPEERVWIRAGEGTFKPADLSALADEGLVDLQFSSMYGMVFLAADRLLAADGLELLAAELPHAAAA